MTKSQENLMIKYLKWAYKIYTKISEPQMAFILNAVSYRNEYDFETFKKIILNK